MSKFQLTAARRRLEASLNHRHFHFRVSTHSRPKAAGFDVNTRLRGDNKFQLTAARRRLGLSGVSLRLQLRFQLTAARRRLAVIVLL